MRSQPDLDSGNLSLFQPAMDSWLKAAREQAAKIGPLTKLVCGNHEAAQVARTCQREPIPLNIF